MNNINTVFEDMQQMLTYFANEENVSRLPVILKLKLLEANVEYTNKLKPIYIAALALRGDKS